VQQICEQCVSFQCFSVASGDVESITDESLTKSQWMGAMSHKNQSENENKSMRVSKEEPVL
jgi:hypothetical protein